MSPAKKLQGTQFLEGVYERDIDLLLLEELTISPEFGAWLVGIVFGNSVLPIDDATAWHSISSSLGESDLVFQFQSAERERRAILMENKVDAPAQPNQGARYQERSKIGQEDYGWVEPKTCIVAPQRYLESHADDTSNYHAKLAYEDIRSWFTDRLNSGKARYKYKADVLTVAIEQSRRGKYSQTQYDEQSTKFWHDYWHLASDEFPELGMKDPGQRGPTSTWVYFPNTHTGKGRSLIHRFENQIVELILDIPADQVGALKVRYDTMLGKGAVIEPVGKSAAIRIEVPLINIREKFEGQKDAVRNGLRAAYRLQAISRFIQWP
jgi:hypothetical protein